jgi:hypothetical protein
VTISAESHRDDFVGSLSNGVTVTGSKVWTDYGTGAPANTSVTFQLYRSTDGGATRTAYGSPVTLNSTTAGRMLGQNCRPAACIRSSKPRY